MMTPSAEMTRYFDATSNRETRDDLKLAVSLVEGSKIAIDCGCGAGSDIAYLRAKNFHVHAFDGEEDAIRRCQDKFGDDDNVYLTQANFNSFNYPKASLVVADASLFFCPENEFGEVWRKITDCLQPQGVFVGSFLGSEDTMAGAGYNGEALWPEVLVVSEGQVRNWLARFDIISFTEHRSEGKSIEGTLHQWHIFSVVAQKKSADV
ncbi:MAG: class I SAM-dependent methyltransferase [Sneathiella sp.]